DYDALLRRCAINFVRGEDSFVRAQWAGRPFVWQIYPQDDAAHHVKLDAFLDRYCAALRPAAATAARSLFAAWNGGGDVGAAWSSFLAHLPETARHNAHWARQLAGQPDLATNLVNFAGVRV
ncbi:MAG: elongation factor P maturation arginine rhamnosyltransferase EarP, partial [Betaproteobacteria bacterium]|nr:elongation factor P maturation arginine rhamnosyltransferase EarP [Betaproteobacteria bacterium]